MVFGTNALFTKPAQSLAPMTVLTILNQFGYEQLKEVTKDSDSRYQDTYLYLGNLKVYFTLKLNFITLGTK